MNNHLKSFSIFMVIAMSAFLGVELFDSRGNFIDAVSATLRVCSGFAFLVLATYVVPNLSLELKGKIALTVAFIGCSVFFLNAGIHQLQDPIHDYRVGELQIIAVFVTTIGLITSILLGGRTDREVVYRKKQLEVAEKIAEFVGDGIILLNYYNKIIFANAKIKEMTGWGTELIGQDHDVLIPERFRVRHSTHIKNYRDDPEVRPMGSADGEFFCLRKDGSEFPVDISLSPSSIGVIASVREKR